MNIKRDSKTRAVSVKLTQYELRCLRVAHDICDIIGRNIPSPRYAQEAENALACVLEELIDQPAEAVMDPEQTGIMQESAKRKK